MLSYASSGYEGSYNQPAYSLGAPVYNSNVSPHYLGRNAPSFAPSNTVYGEYAPPHGHPSMNSTAGYPIQSASTSLLPNHPRHPPHLVDSLRSLHQRSDSTAEAFALQHHPSLVAANASQPSPVMGQGSRGQTRIAGTQDHRSLLPPTPRTPVVVTVANPSANSGPTLVRNFPNKASSFRFTLQQRDVLRELYSRKKYPSRDELVQLARQLDAPERSVDAWFRTQRTRTKDLREKIEIKTSDRPKQAEGTTLSDEQERILRDAFERDSSLDRDRRMGLARQLGLREQVIEDWFLRRRREKVALEDNKAATS
ncbi:hypothetical protein C8Q74DRAFT_683179 [Fomes fomentarius]|nr:hypothetical protein C8Q74DRAFT_683179 [Fomes fomentarius]